MTNDLRIADAPLLVDVSGEEKLPTGGYGNYSTTINQIADFTQLKWKLATEGYVNNEINVVTNKLNNHTQDKKNPHEVTKEQVGLGEVDNTADLDKPVSAYQRTAIDEKIAKTSIVDNLTTNDSTKVLSAKQGKILQDTKANKADVNESLGLKVDRSEVYAKDEVYNKDETLTLEREDQYVITESGRTQREKNKDFITADDLGLLGDGSNETEKLAELDAVYQDRSREVVKPIIDLQGKTITVDNYKAYLNTINGYFRVLGSTNQNNLIFPSRLQHAKVGNTGVSLGVNVLTNYIDGASSNRQKSNVFIGNNIAQNTKATLATIAIGDRIFENVEKIGHSNIAIGGSNMINLKSTTEAYGGDNSGTRNIALGAIALRSLTTGYTNTALGRNAMQCATTSTFNVAVGGNALSGYAPVGLSGDIEAQSIGTHYQNTAIGVGAGNKVTSGYNNTIVGHQAGFNLKNGQGMVIIGAESCKELDANISSKNTTIVSRDTQDVTYTVTNGVVDLNVQNTTGMVVGGFVNILFTNGALSTITTENQILKILSIEGLIVKLDTSLNLTEVSGSGKIVEVSNNTTANITNINSVVVGLAACDKSAQVTRSVVLGYGSANTPSIINSVALGERNLEGTLKVDSSVSFGRLSGSSVGSTANFCSFLGHNTGRTLIDGTTGYTLANSTMVGANANVAGNNEVQLGDSATTTYVYGTVQNRSDERDKADIRDTKLGLDFINSLRPVDYKWDMREDYSSFKSDGSKKRNRYHHGFIAQEVPKDFGGYQDHKINGGADVLSLGYDEFIAPIVKAMQELSKEVEYLKKQLESK